MRRVHTVSLMPFHVVTLIGLLQVRDPDPDVPDHERVAVLRPQPQPQGGGQPARSEESQPILYYMNDTYDKEDYEKKHYKKNLNDNNA